MSSQSLTTSYVKTYQEQSITTGNSVIYLQRYAANASKIGNPVEVTPTNVVSGTPSTLLLSDGGVLVTYDYYDPTDSVDPYPYIYFGSRLVRPNDVVNAGGISSLNDAGSNDQGTVVRDLATISLKGGGYAYVLETNSRDNAFNWFDTRTFGLVSAAGQIIPATVVEQSSHSDKPYPLESASTVKELANGNIAVGWTAAYDPGSAGAGYYQPGQTTFTEIFNRQGHSLYATSVDFNGAVTIDNFDSQGRVTSVVTKPGDGSTDTKVYKPGTHQVTSEAIHAANGSRTEIDFAVVGQSYTQQTGTYDKNGKLLHLTRTYANGVVALDQMNNSNGTSSVASYDVSGRPTTSIASAADGSREVTVRTYAGASTTPSTVDDVRYGPKGQKLSENLALADFTHTQTAFAAGVALTSTPTFRDRFTASVAGGDTFVFQPAFGQDLITNFHAGSGANHDKVDLTALHIQSGTQGASDFFAQHLKQIDTSAVLLLSSHEVLTLANTQVVSLTKDNVIL